MDARLPEPAIEFLPFQPYHLRAIRLQPEQRQFMEALRDPDYAEALNCPGLAWSGIIDGKLVGSAGVLPKWPGRAQAWALLSPIPKRAWVRLTREVLAVLEQAHLKGYRRIETTVLASFPQAHRWVELLGFDFEGLMRCYGPDGSDHCRYARVRSTVGADA